MESIGHGCIVASRSELCFLICHSLWRRVERLTDDTTTITYVQKNVHICFTLVYIFQYQFLWNLASGTKFLFFMAIIYFHEGYSLLCHHNPAEAKKQWNVCITRESDPFVVACLLVCFWFTEQYHLNNQACTALTLSGLKPGMTIEGIDRRGRKVLRTLWVSLDLKYMQVSQDRSYVRWPRLTK